LTELRGTTTLVGILGWPVSHSLSPSLQNAAFDALGLDWAYVPLPTHPDALADAIRGLAAAGFAGANVTIPHKTSVLALCDEVDEVAAVADSVNTLVFRDGRVRGASTDITAIASVVEAHGLSALVLGSGGSAKAAVAALRSEGAEVTTATRHDADWPPNGAAFDIVVNATPVKDDPIVTPRSGQQIVDLPYNADGAPTALISAARAAGCERIVDGLDILIAQGAASFELWTGLPAPFNAMREALRLKSS
jgi:shikimate dehydrogenase